MMDFNEFLDCYRKSESEIRSRSNSDYEVNDDKMNRLNSLIEYIRDLAELDSDMVVDPVKLEPRRINSGITVYTNVVFVFEDGLTRFAEAIKNADSMSIDATVDGRVCISFGISNVFKKK